MARPEKKNADYHTHDKDMRHDPKVLAVRRKFKHEGYAVYNMMLEILDDADHFRYEWNQLNIELLAADFDSEKFEEIIAYCIKLGLFTVETGYIFSYQHQKRFKPLLSKRKQRIDTVSESETPGNNVSDADNPHSIVKYSKVKNTDIPKVEELGTDAVASGPPPAKKVDKRKKQRQDNPETLAPVKDFFTEKMQGKWPAEKIALQAEKFFNHYTANGWVQNKGKPIVNWKSAVSNWILNEVNFIPVNGKHQPVNNNGANGVSSKSQPPPEEKKLSNEKKQQISRDFMEDCFVDFCNGQLFLPNVLVHYYNQLVQDGLLVLSPEDKERIKKLAEGDLQKSKLIAVEEYFTRLKDSGAKRIYPNVKTTLTTA